MTNKPERPVSQIWDQMIWTFVGTAMITLLIGATYLWRAGLWQW